MKLKYIAIIFVIPFFISCGPIFFGTEYFKDVDFDFKNTQNKKIGLIVMDNGKKTGFINSFKNQYKSNDVFIQSIYDIVIAGFTDKGLTIKPIPLAKEYKDIFCDKTGYFDNVGVIQEKTDVWKTLVKEYDVDVLFIVNAWEVADYHESRYDSMSKTTISSVFCQIFLNGCIIDGDGVLKYAGQSNGSSNVSFFMYKTALVKAVKNSIDRFALIFTGGVKDENLEKKHKY